MVIPTYDFKNKTVLISGTTGEGVGTALVNNFLAAGATVIANSKDEEKLFCFWKDEINEGQVIPFVGDITKEENFNKILEKNIDVDIIVNNAASSNTYSDTGSLKYEDWQLDINTILLGSFNLVKFFIPKMKIRGGGKIINISSSAAIKGSWGRPISYATAKAGLLGFTKQLALELAPFDINVNCITPCQILTPRVLRNGRRTLESVELYAKENIPLGRPASVDDIANLVLFLASDAASFITGEVINLDGGISLSRPNFLEK